MSGADANELPVVNLSTPCRHLRNKGMYVYADSQYGESQDDYDSTIFWCVKTLKNFGPDDDLVGREDCRNASRNCYEPF